MTRPVPHLTFILPILPGPAPADLAEAGPGQPRNQAQHGEELLKRAKAHAERCGIPLATAAGRVDDPQLKAMDEWRADVKAYSAAHKCSELEAHLAVPFPT